MRIATRSVRQPRNSYICSLQGRDPSRRKLLAYVLLTANELLWTIMVVPTTAYVFWSFSFVIQAPSTVREHLVRGCSCNILIAGRHKRERERETQLRSDSSGEKELRGSRFPKISSTMIPQPKVIRYQTIRGAQPFFCFHSLGLSHLLFQ